MKTKLLVIVFIQFINTIFAQNKDCSNVIKFDKAISSSNVVDFFSIQQFINQSNYDELSIGFDLKNTRGDTIFGSAQIFSFEKNRKISAICAESVCKN